MPVDAQPFFGKVSVFGRRYRSIPRESGLRRHPGKRTSCAQGEYFRDLIRLGRCTMRARTCKSGPIGPHEPVSAAPCRTPDPIPIFPRAAPVHAYRPPRGDPERRVRGNRNPVPNPRPLSRKITTNRKVSRYGSEFRTCRAQVKFCESAHPAARLEESGTPQ